MAVVIDLHAGLRLGRLELRRSLGRGAQAEVWLAWDPHLEREVAVKLLDPRSAPESPQTSLAEARAVSRLAHPNIVPLFEAGEFQDRHYLVFELVTGSTLSQALQERGAWPGPEAAALMCGVLDALSAAHAAGIVHRDLKPSNILMGADGRARVMDFGIAARLNERPDGRVVGTPGFISPEAARGLAPTPSMDVFAAGALLAQLLTGKPVLRERDPYRALERVMAEDLVVPSPPGVFVDDALRAIAQRALQREATQRWDSAEQMRKALQAWLAPRPADEGHRGRASGTLEFLLRRMKHKSDFPALSDAVGRIQRVTASETASLGTLAEEILKDVALTHKLLRLANAAAYRQAGSGSVSTVSRAAAVVGFAGIRNLALSLVLVEHMQDKAHAVRLKEEFLRALMAATLAGELCPTPRQGEEAFLVAMMQNLGRLLTEYYFPEEAAQVRRSTWRDGQWRGAEAEEAASLEALGIGFEELGCGIARAWGLPETLQKAMRRSRGPVPKQAQQGVELLRWLGHAANELTLALLNGDPLDRHHVVRAAAEPMQRALALDGRAVLAAVDRACQQVRELAQALALNPAPGSAARKLLWQAQPPREVPARILPDGPTLTLAAPAGAVPDNALQRRRDCLNAGIADVTLSLVADEFRLQDVLNSILRMMHEALAARRVVLCLRDARGTTITGRFGVGEAVDAACQALRVPLAPASVDLFAVVCRKGADLLVEDASCGPIVERLPPWFRQGLGAPSFLLLPMTLRSSAFGLIYVDHTQPAGIRLTEAELAMLRTLRNQAVMAFKTSGAQ